MHPAAFAMPAGMAIRYDRPTADIARSVTGYNVYHADSAAERVDWFLPAPAMLCIGVGAGPITAQIRNQRFDPMPQASLIGPTSRALRVATQGGTMVGIGISAAGWIRMTGQSAHLCHNQILPAETLLGTEAVAGLIAALEAAPDDHAVKPLLDGLLPPLFGRDDPQAATIDALMALSVQDGVIEVGDVAQRIGLHDTMLRRVSQRAFGMPPKLLLRRARFLRSFVHLFLGGDIDDRSRIDSSYFDMSHYLRDANAFLGTTPRRFLQAATPFLAASIRARMAVLGAPTQALHEPPTAGRRAG
ncbi:MAG TPA: hypothetical protein VF649_11795 [Sphingomonas sp.]|uniref:hypothetical protein n=1 Tax=Sphingomonas sp. TaxID=28214 RepID=UPI002ED956C3